MKIKTSELEGSALDWSVAAATGVHDDGEHALMEIGLGRYSPSTDWSQGGLLIYKIASLTQDHSGNWYAIPKTEYEVIELTGPTLLIAAMRAIVAFEMGDEVDVPEELAGGA